MLRRSEYIGQTDRGGLSSGLTACVAAARRRTPHYNHLRTLEEEPLPPMLFSEAPVAVGPTLSPRDFFKEWKKKVEEKGGDKRERGKDNIEIKSIDLRCRRPLSTSRRTDRAPRKKMLGDLPGAKNSEAAPQSGHRKNYDPPQPSPNGPI